MNTETFSVCGYDGFLNDFTENIYDVIIINHLNQFEKKHW